MTRTSGRRAAEVPVDPVDTGHGRAELLRDADRRSAWMLLVDGLPQSHVDLDDPRYLDFEYVRRLGHVIDTAAPAAQPLHVLHLGAGALTLARYVAATRPGSKQLAVEIDAALVDLVRLRLPLRRVRIRVGDARAVLERLPAGSFDVVVVDVFAGGRTPAHLTSAEFVAAARRVLRASPRAPGHQRAPGRRGAQEARGAPEARGAQEAPEAPESQAAPGSRGARRGQGVPGGQRGEGGQGPQGAQGAQGAQRAGVFAANVADGAPLTHARTQVAIALEVFSQACLIADAAVLRGRRFGNLVLAASTGPLPVERLTRLAAADPMPGRVLHGDELIRFTAGAKPVSDANARPSPAPPSGVFAFLPPIWKPVPQVLPTP